VIGISDTGTGMPADIVAKAIDPFFTTKSVGEGTGLGLSMVYSFAKQSRGHMRIYSEVGHGTTVKLFLPRALQDAVDLEKPVEEAPQGQGETILVVEDDATVRLIGHGCGPSRLASLPAQKCHCRVADLLELGLRGSGAGTQSETVHRRRGNLGATACLLGIEPGIVKLPRQRSVRGRHQHGELSTGCRIVAR
jgi:histidine kinase/DNA gyrase B/HSP90-like ATPase